MPSRILPLTGRPATPEEHALQEKQRESLKQGVMEHPLIRPENADLLRVDPQGGAL